MEEVYNVVTNIAVQVLVIVILSLISVATAKLSKFLDRMKKSDELGIIDMITDQIVDFVEAEFKGLKGLEKREHAVDLSLEILSAKGIKVSRDEVLAGIENGVRKMNDRKSQK